MKNLVRHIAVQEFTEVKFGEVKLLIEPQVYKPREDSFLLAAAVEKFASGNVLDMGTGSGIQAIVAAKKKEVMQVTAVDASENALKCAEANAVSNKVKEKINFICSNLFENVDGIFDTVIFNPPYVPVEPEEKLDAESMAWHGGKDGRSVLEPFLDTFSPFVSPGGQLLLLQSSLNDLEKTERKLKALKFSTEVISTEAFFFEKIHVLRALKLKL
ncbi:MAG: methyltransferase [Candidatus Micrarchaeota archaeon]|nr:methyltransferase [Candidatus Micrarchaeota archaeon]